VHRVLRTACIVLLALLLGMTSGCTAQSPTLQGGDIKGPLVLARDLGTVEISKYEGKPLNDFKALPDNSVRGPQTVDITSYRLVIDGAVRSPPAPHLRRGPLTHALPETHHAALCRRMECDGTV